MIELIVLNGFFVYYMLNLLLLPCGGAGPSWFMPEIDVHWVDGDDNLVSWKATWSDCLRVVLGVYEISSKSDNQEDKSITVWYARSNQITALFECEFCLGFWLAAIAVLLNSFTKTDILNISFYTVLSVYSRTDILIIFLNLILIVLSSAGAGAFLFAMTSKEEINVPPEST